MSRNNKQMYTVRSKEDPTKTCTADWQNASELVRHGRWSWVRDGGKEFERAKSAALATDSELTLVVDETADPAKEPTNGSEKEEVSPEVPSGEAGAEAPVSAEEEGQVAPTPAGPTAPEVDLVNMEREELFEYGASLGIALDKRLGTKNLIAAIQAKIGAE